MVLSSGPHSSHSFPSAHGSPGSTPAVVDGAIAIHMSPDPDGCSSRTPIAYTELASHAGCPFASQISLQVQYFSDHASKSTPGAPTNWLLIP